jgi:hypothetical protein
LAVVWILTWLVGSFQWLETLGLLLGVRLDLRLEQLRLVHGELRLDQETSGAFGACGWQEIEMPRVRAYQ